MRSIAAASSTACDRALAVALRILSGNSRIWRAVICG